MADIKDLRREVVRAKLQAKLALMQPGLTEEKREEIKGVLQEAEKQRQQVSHYRALGYEARKTDEGWEVYKKQEVTYEVPQEIKDLGEQAVEDYRKKAPEWSKLPEDQQSKVIQDFITSHLSSLPQDKQVDWHKKYTNVEIDDKTYSVNALINKGWHVKTEGGNLMIKPPEKYELGMAVYNVLKQQGWSKEEISTIATWESFKKTGFIGDLVRVVGDKALLDFYVAYYEGRKQGKWSSKEDFAEKLSRMPFYGRSKQDILNDLNKVEQRIKDKIPHEGEKVFYERLYDWAQEQVKTGGRTSLIDELKSTVVSPGFTTWITIPTVASIAGGLLGVGSKVVSTTATRLITTGTKAGRLLGYGIKGASTTGAIALGAAGVVGTGAELVSASRQYTISRVGPGGEIYRETVGGPGEMARILTGAGLATITGIRGYKKGAEWYQRYRLYKGKSIPGKEFKLKSREIRYDRGLRYQYEIYGGRGRRTTISPREYEYWKPGKEAEVFMRYEPETGELKYMFRGKEIKIKGRRIGKMTVTGERTVGYNLRYKPFEIKLLTEAKTPELSPEMQKFYEMWTERFKATSSRYSKWVSALRGEYVGEPSMEAIRPVTESSFAEWIGGQGKVKFKPKISKWLSFLKSKSAEASLRLRYKPELVYKEPSGITRTSLVPRFEVAKVPSTIHGEIVGSLYGMSMLQVQRQTPKQIVKIKPISKMAMEQRQDIINLQKLRQAQQQKYDLVKIQAYEQVLKTTRPRIKTPRTTIPTVYIPRLPQKPKKRKKPKKKKKGKRKGYREREFKWAFPSEVYKPKEVKVKWI